MRTLWIHFVLIAVLLASLLINVDSQTTVAAAGPDYRFGVVESYAAPGAATALGAGWTRVTFRWNEIQTNGPDEWNVGPISDGTLANELAQGRQVVGLLESSLTPSECVDNPGVCHRSRSCAVRDIWIELKTAMDGVLQSITLQDLVERQQGKAKTL